MDAFSQHLFPEEEYHIARARTFEELCDIALPILQRMPQPIIQVCGPISHGGVGSITENLRRFEAVIEELGGQGLHVFSQLPFEGSMQHIKVTPYYMGDDHLLETFYLPIFQSGFVRSLYFLPDWTISYGACWEYSHATRLGMEIVYL